MDYQVLNKRITIFPEPSLTFDEKYIAAYINEFLDMKLLPSISKGYQVKFTADRYTGEEVMTLNLKRLDDSLMAEFNPDRVDIITRVANKSWEDFYNDAMQIVGRLVEKLDVRISRIALGANIKYVVGSELKDKAYNKLVVSNTEESPVEWNIRKVIRSNFASENGNEIPLNNVYTLSLAESNQDCLNLELDYNTVVNAGADTVTSERERIIQKFMESVTHDTDLYRKTFESWK